MGTRTSGVGITGAEGGHDCSDGGDNGIYVKGECATRIVRRRDNGRISGKVLLRARRGENNEVSQATGLAFVFFVSVIG